ncbi:uncharacterized protein LOC144578515 isoform X2 [Callithrix jacchus]
MSTLIASPGSSNGSGERRGCRPRPCARSGRTEATAVMGPADIPPGAGLGNGWRAAGQERCLPEICGARACAADSTGEPSHGCLQAGLRLCRLQAGGHGSLVPALPAPSPTRPAGMTGTDGALWNAKLSLRTAARKSSQICDIAGPSMVLYAV